MLKKDSAIVTGAKVTLGVLGVLAAVNLVVFGVVQAGEVLRRRK